MQIFAVQCDFQLLSNRPDPADFMQPSPTRPDPNRQGSTNNTSSLRSAVILAYYHKYEAKLLEWTLFRPNRHTFPIKELVKKDEAGQDLTFLTSYSWVAKKFGLNLVGLGLFKSEEAESTWPKTMRLNPSGPGNDSIRNSTSGWDYRHHEKAMSGLSFLRSFSENLLVYRLLLKLG